MENVKITSSISKKTKNIILGISVSCLILALTFLICLSFAGSFICKDDYHYYDKWNDITHTYSDCGSRDNPFANFFSGIAFFAGCFFLIFFPFFLLISKMQIIVTDKRVYGKTYFGRSVDLPIDSISAVGSSMFNGIAVATSSGKIKFLFIEESNVVREEILKLIIARQDEKKIQNAQLKPTNDIDEIKKYKELLDSGVITEEEFNQKKKQLLGL